MKPYTESISGTLVKFDMTPLPAGEITLASNPNDPKKAPPRTVKIKPFWMGKTELTWDAYDVWYLFLDEPGNQGPIPTGKGEGISRPTRPYGAPDRGFGHAGYPAISMTYLAAEEYAKWLSKKTGKKYRLPTEAEWEYACRAGTNSLGPTDPAALQKVAWVYENADFKTHPVGQKPANAWGLHDMLGNSGEWATGLDGKPVLMGGSFNDDADKVHCSARAYQTPDWNVTDPQTPKGKWWLPDAPFAGFRLVREE
ncbi:MAG: formylglycine-generating enzyme family protein [Armatimonadetes bacterium]|nr:formylglycine-generating enzyme family protein [Armatimonadota bacterium]